MSGTELTANEQDLPISLVNKRVVSWPVVSVRVPANLYVFATVVVKADMTNLGDPGDDWQDAYVDPPLPVELFERDDVLADLCPSFLVGHIEREETGLAGGTDDWGLALDQAPGRPPQVVPPPLGVDAWWQDKDDPRLLALRYRVRNRGNSQLWTVCFAFDALVYRPGVQLDGPSWRPKNLKRAAVRIGDG
jgi:hypothetical protein